MSEPEGKERVPNNATTSKVTWGQPGWKRKLVDHDSGKTPDSLISGEKGKQGKSFLGPRRRPKKERWGRNTVKVSFGTKGKGNRRKLGVIGR